MIDPILVLGCLGITACSLICARALLRLHRGCEVLAKGQRCDRGLMRFYAGAFDLPARVADGLTAASAVMLFVGYQCQASPALLVTLGVLLGINSLERFCAGIDRRRLQRAWHPLAR